MPTGADWNSLRRYLVVVAHPDDAEFSAAGTIALLTEAGKHVVIVQVTSGDKGTPDPSVATSHLSPPARQKRSKPPNGLVSQPSTFCVRRMGSSCLICISAD